MSKPEQQDSPIEPVAEAEVESLRRALDRVYRTLRHATRNAEAEERPTALLANEPCVSLHRLVSIFGLSPFERDVLLLCAGTDLERRFLDACAAAHRDSRANWPTFGLALSTLEAPHWSSISPARPLRYWRLIEVDSGPLLHAPLRIDERILQFLVGVPAFDEHLDSLVRPMNLNFSGALATRFANLAEAINPAVSHWKRLPASREPILLVSNHRSTRQAAFIAICRQMGLRPCSLQAADIPVSPADRERFARLWTRESVLSDTALCIQTEDLDNQRSLIALLDQLETPIAVEVQPGSQADRLEGLRIHLPPMSASERKLIWNEYLGPAVQKMNGHLDEIIDQFQFDESGIQISALTARETIAAKQGDDAAQPAGQITWNICRRHARRSLDNLAQRLEPRGVWVDLILPDQQIETLQQIVVHVRRRAIVNEQWGFAARYERGLGLSVLFSGTSGTGKTMAAEIIAAELDLDLYRIDLASTVSKYIGETEKNLRRIFDAAEESSAILLFDEADALFGKRTEVRDSHDRYANLEVSYLLQRIECYRGVAILTTNMQHALDSAFVRRIRFIVQFPFPDRESRARIWRRIFPSATPIGSIDYDLLAQLNVSGGVIRNIAMHAAFRAAEDQEPVNMKHLFAASRSEYAKMDKPLTEPETRGWL